MDYAINTINYKGVGISEKVYEKAKPERVGDTFTIGFIKYTICDLNPFDDELYITTASNEKKFEDKRWSEHFISEMIKNNTTTIIKSTKELVI